MYQQPQFDMNRVNTANFSNFPVNNPPFVPDVTSGIHPKLVEYLPFASGVVMSIMQNTAGDNPLRTYLANQVSRSNWRNPDYARMVAMVCDLADLILSLNRANDPDEAIPAAAERVVEFLAADNVRHDRALGQQVSDDLVGPINAALAEFDDALGGIAQRQRQRQQAGSYQRQSGGGGGGWQSNRQTGHLSTAGNSSGGNWRNSNSGSSSGWQRNTTSNASSSSMSHRLPPNAQRTSEQPQQHQQTYISNLSTNPKEVKVLATQQQERVDSASTDFPSTTPSGWKRSQRYPYPPAYDFFKYELNLGFDADGNVVPEIRKRTEEEMKDYATHTTNPVFGKTPRTFDRQRVREELKELQSCIVDFNMQKQIPRETESTGGEGQPAATVRDDFSLELFEGQAWMGAEADRFRARIEGKDGLEMPMIYRCYTIVADPVFVLKDEIDMLRNFGSSNTYIELREKLVAAGGKMNSRLLGEAKMKVTDMINRILGQNMGLVERITSFVDDIADIQDLIESNYGAKILESFFKYQAENIRAAFVTLSKDSADELSLPLTSMFAEGEAPEVTYLCSKYSFTLLNRLSYELELGVIDVGTASILTEDLTPALYYLAKGLFDDEAEQKMYMFRNYVRTEDGRLFELTRGYMADVYLLTVIR